MIAKKWVFVVCVAVITLSPQRVSSQIPTACSNEESLQSLTCCPDDCGSADGRGACANLSLPHDIGSTDVRGNWPHYFTMACACTSNYGGVDCSRCKYGYYGENCDQKQVGPRNSIHELTDQDWSEYINILKMTRTYNSNYKVVMREYLPGTTDIETADIGLYDFFVWQHHFAAKDSECGADDNCTKVDYAHEATGFPTWHRQYLLWLEWEIQWMLREQGDTEYYNFRLHYWDWRREDRAEEILERNRLGMTAPNENGQPQVYGDLFSDGWDTVCWYGGSGGVDETRGTICDPTVKTGPLLRCPFLSTDPCSSSNPNWPTTAEVDTAISKPIYDAETYDRGAAAESFRNFMEGFDSSVAIEDCANNDLCICDIGGINCDSEDASSPLQRRLHNTVHIIVGIGDFNSNLDGDMKGVMADVAASPNDPIFINHHGMVDCILEEWLQDHDDHLYPDVPDDLKGHQGDAPIVPFFPVFTHQDVFNTAENFGYSCELSGSAALPKPQNWILVIGAVLCVASLMNYTPY